MRLSSTGVGRVSLLDAVFLGPARLSWGSVVLKTFGAPGFSKWMEKASKGSHGTLFMGQAWRGRASPVLTFQRLERGPTATSNDRKPGEYSPAGGRVWTLRSPAGLTS